MKASRHIAISAIIFTASVVGLWILVFLDPDRPDGSMTTSERTLAVVGSVLVLPGLPLNCVVEWFRRPVSDVWWIMGCNLISALLWPFLFGFLSRLWKHENTEPVTAPNRRQLADVPVRKSESGAGR